MSDITENKEDVSSSNIMKENSHAQISNTGKYFMYIPLTIYMYFILIKNHDFFFFVDIV